MKQLDDIKLLAEMASSQWGLFTTAQAERDGVSRLQLSRLAEKGQIERLAFGVYRVVGAPKDRFQDIKVAWLSLEPRKLVRERQDERERGFVVGGHTATYLYEAGDLWPTPYLFLSSSRKQTQRQDIQLRKRTLDKNDVVLVEGVPVTTPEYTIATLATEGEDLSLIADVASALASKRVLDGEELAELLSPYAKKYGFKAHEGKAFARHLLHGFTQARIREARLLSRLHEGT